MLDHIGFAVTDFAKAKTFYLKALAPLGVGLLWEVTPEQTGGDAHAGFGEGDKAYFWIGTSAVKPSGNRNMHVAFTAPDRKTVDAFYQTALEAGAKDNGPPGLRPHYHPTYYGAFVLDADGNNIEAVCHKPE